MISRRHFTLAATAAALSAPALLRAQSTYAVPPEFMPAFVRVKPQFAPGQILIVPSQHYLYYVTEPRKAIRYGVGVGRAGLEFKGVATIDVKKMNPTWRPTDEMIERDPVTYAKFVNNDYVMPGGPGNPLGICAMYLFQNGRDTFFRIHGTTAPESIGRSVSNGCIRMINEHVLDLYARVEIGTVVTVV